MTHYTLLCILFAWKEEAVTRAILTSLIAVFLGPVHAAADLAAPSNRLQPASQINKKAEISQQYKLAKDGNAASQLLIGVRYLELRNFAKALYWLEISASQGNAEAQMHLGNAYARGTGVPVDLVKAHMWLDLAAAQGGYEAQFWFEYLASQMTPEQIARAQVMAREWRQQEQ